MLETRPTSAPTVSQRAIARYDRRRRRIILAIEAILLLAIVWLVGPRLAALRAAMPAVAAALLVLFFWACAFALELGVFVAVSWDDFRDLALASLRASAPAMWLAPAILLLTSSHYAAKAAGLALVAYATWSLLSRKTPQKLQPNEAADWARHHRFFRESMTASYPTFRKESLPPILGALALQTGVCGIIGGRPILAAPLIALGAAFWTWWSIVRGAVERREIDRPSHWLLSVLLILLLTLSFATEQIRMQVAEMQAAAPAGDAPDPELADVFQHVWKELEEAPKPDPQKPRKKNVTHLTQPNRSAATREIAGGGGGAYLAPGVIVRPEAPQPKLEFSMGGTTHAQPAPVAADRKLNMAFSGEYQIFPTSSRRLQHDWAMESGTLLDHLYATAAGGSLETEAYQRLAPPVDFTHCGQIRVTLASDESAPFAVEVHLVTRTGEVDLGTEICGLERGKEETLVFAVPQSGDLLANAIRIGFHRIPAQGKQSVKVDLRWFTLVPR
jgi:hypothetical protein